MTTIPSLQLHLDAALTRFPADQVHAYQSRDGFKPTLVRRLTSLWSRSDNTAALVITPDGLALKQDSLFGYAPWTEIEHVSFGEHKPFQLTDPHTHLTLAVPGCDIHLPDIYDIPLNALHQLIVQYWNASRSH